MFHTPLLFPDFRPEAYIHDEHRLYRVLRREDTVSPRALKIEVEDAADSLDLDGERIYKTRWFTHNELEEGGFELACPPASPVEAAA